jgi:hypothetical protein
MYHKLSKTTPWRKDQNTFLYHGIKRIYGPFKGGGIRDIYPRNNYILCQWNTNKKPQKLIYFTELRLKTIKNSFLCGNFD